MTITATPDAGSAPPSILVEVASPVGTVMSAVRVWRNDSSGRTLLRTQPLPGFDARSVSDVEMPYGENLTYSWEATYSDPDESVVVFAEDWSGWPTGWSGVTAGGTVAAGVLTYQPPADPFQIVTAVRPAAVDWQSIRIESLSTTPVGGGLTLNIGAQLILSSEDVGAGAKLKVYFPGLGTLWTTIDPSQPFTLSQFGTSILFEGAGGVLSITAPYALLTSITLSGGDDGGERVAVGAITVSAAGPDYTIAETSAPVTITPDNGWLIHPAKPALSFPILEDDKDRAGIKELGAIHAASTTTLHHVLGNEYPVAVNNGPRLSDELNVSFTLATADELDAMRGLLSDQTPILFRFPPAWGQEFNDGFYSVGDLVIERLAQMPGLSYRNVTLPLTATESPIVTVEISGWSYAAVAAEFATYSDVLSTFASYADLATNTRS